MIGKLLFLGLLALSQARPEVVSRKAETHEDLPNGCPADPEVDRKLPHESDCSKFYYCVFGEIVLRPCPPGLYFNSTVSVCDWPWNVDCDSSGGGGDGEGDGGADGDGGGGGGGGGDDEAGGDNGGGDDNGGDGGEEDGGDDGGGGGGDDGAGEDAEGDDDGGVVGEDLPNGCPADFDINRLLPHEYNCSKFYHCSFGELLLRQCPSGLYFNASISACDWPWNVDCETSGGGGGGDGDNGVEDDGEDDSGDGDDGGDGGEGGGDEGDGENGDDGGSEGDNGAGDGENLPNGCPADFDVHRLLPHENDCNKFYYCVFGEIVLRQCSPGLYFNPIASVCDWPWNVNCESSDGGDGEDGGGGGGEDDGGAGGDGEGDGDEDGDDDGPGEDDGDGDDGAGGDGEDTDEGGEDLPNGCPEDFGINRLLPHEYDCSKFYQCVFGEAVLRQCPPGLYFNPVISVCDWPWNVDCESGGGGEDDGGGGDDGDGEGGGDDGSESEQNQKCADNCNVLPWPHDVDLDKFWICDGKRARLVQCSEGLQFNRYKYTCDF